jgi:hypothetical protein
MDDVIQPRAACHRELFGARRAKVPRIDPLSFDLHGQVRIGGWHASFICTAYDLFHIDPQAVLQSHLKGLRPSRS